MNDLQEMFEKITGGITDANVNKVFGQPRELGNRTLIPVAEVSYGFGAGYGFAEGEGEDEVDIEATTEQTERGGGGGAGARVRPLAYIEVGPEGTKITAIEDEQKIALAGILLVAWIAGWVGLVIKEIFD